jgi:hypothetical protein
VSFPGNFGGWNLRLTASAAVDPVPPCLSYLKRYQTHSTVCKRVATRLLAMYIPSIGGLSATKRCGVNSLGI